MKKQRGTGAVSSVEELGVLMAEKEKIKMMVHKERVCLSCKGEREIGAVRCPVSEGGLAFIIGDKLRGS